MADKPKTLNFEKHLKELEALVSQLEAGDMSLEDSLKAYERGVELTRLCQGALEEAQLRIQKVVESNGEITSTPLDNASE